jgi:hypothetical protein
MFGSCNKLTDNASTATDIMDEPIIIFFETAFFNGLMYNSKNVKNSGYPKNQKKSASEGKGITSKSTSYTIQIISATSQHIVAMESNNHAFP